MIELILFVGLVVLFVQHQKLATSFENLRREMDELRTAPADAVVQVPPPSPDPVPVAASKPLAAEPGAPGGPEARSDWVGAVDEGGEDGADGAPPPVRETMATLLERLVGGRLLIWVGGIAFALGGIFLVRYSIGRVTPTGRMILAALLGILLLAAGEFSRSRPGGKVDPRVAQALVGAGILVLYATPYGALILYGLISNATAFGLMAAVTALALILSLRHGVPTAMLGLAGGFATPALVGDPADSAIPLLAYIGLLDLALFVLAQRRGWTWLAAAATGLSFVWTFWLLAGPPNFALAGGAFIVALSLAASLATPGEGRYLAQMRPAGIGLFQLALLVGRDDLGLPAWYLFGALALASFLLAWRGAEHRPLPVFALFLALILLAAQAFAGPDPRIPSIGAAITLLFVAGALPGVLRDEKKDQWLAIATAAFAAPAIVLRAARPELLERPGWGGLLLALALGPALLAWSRRGSASRTAIEPVLSFAAAAALVLAGIAVWDLVARDLLAAAWLLLAAGVALAAGRIGDRGLNILSLLAAALAVLWAVGTVPGLWTTIGDSIAGVPALVTGLETVPEALQRLVVPAAILFLAWHWLPDTFEWPRRALLAVAGIVLAGALYIGAKQIFGLSGEADFVARGFAERAMITQALFLAGWIFGGRRVRLPWLDAEQVRRIGTILTGIAAARLVWFDMLLHNPTLVDQNVGPMPLFNLIAPAFLLSAAWLYAARRREPNGTMAAAWLVLFLASLIGGVMLLVRQLFHGAILTGPDLAMSEYYSYSLAGLLLAIGLMLSGIRLSDKALRMAGLALLSVTAVKIFIADVRKLEDIWRILSFLGLGAVAVGIGKLYAAILRAEARPASP